MECLAYVARSFHDRDSRPAHKPINSHRAKNNRNANGVGTHAVGVAVKHLKQIGVPHVIMPRIGLRIGCVLDAIPHDLSMYSQRFRVRVVLLVPLLVAKDCSCC